ncbi:MAG: hypothetical protein IKF82_00605 [Bacilli bacterium]|nr:hypothetical protein [Bacilli bacterium]
MKILLICGESGVGKSTIAHNLGQYATKYKLIKSYTDRPKRPKEYDHIFVDKDVMDFLPIKDIAAFTKINGYRYCALYSQFDDDKINVYVVDAPGIADTFKAFPDAEIEIVLIKRTNVYIDEERKNRNIILPLEDKTIHIVDNNSTIMDAVNDIRQIYEVS